MIKFQQNGSKQEVIHCVLRSTNLLILFPIKIIAAAVEGRKDESGRSAYSVTSLLPATHKQLFSIFLSKYVGEIIGYHQYEFFYSAFFR
jgi:hypothetical protein